MSAEAFSAVQNGTAANHGGSPTSNRTNGAADGADSGHHRSEIHLSPDSNIDQIQAALQNARVLYEDALKGETNGRTTEEIELAKLVAELVKLMNSQFIAKEVIVRGIAYMREKGLPPRSAINHAKRDRRLLHPKTYHERSHNPRGRSSGRSNGVRLNDIDDDDATEAAAKDSVLREVQNTTKASAGPVSGKDEKAIATGEFNGGKNKKRNWRQRRGKKNSQSEERDGHKIEKADKDIEVHDLAVDLGKTKNFEKDTVPARPVAPAAASSVTENISPGVATHHKVETADTQTNKV